MGLRRNILASYASQAYVAAVGIVALPFYLRFLGAEAYGLAGFFAMLQAWFLLLDIGLTPTMARETARFRGHGVSAHDYASLVRVLRALFVCTAVAGGGLLFLLAGPIAQHWLQAAHLPVAEVENALRIMAVIVALRWMCGLYRSIVTGSEQLVWLGNFNAAFATVRSIGVLLALHHIAPTAAVFFGYQLVVAIAELALLARHAHTLVPAGAPGRSLREAIGVVRPLVRFSLSVAFTASVWIFVTQTDKLILSKILPLAEYGYFTLAVLVAGGVMVISGPVSAALLPYMARLEALQDQPALIEAYRRSTQLVVVLAAAASLTLALCAEPLLYAWSGDRLLAGATAPALMLYALGNGILTVSSFPYYLQYAKGNLRMHITGSMLFVVFLIPVMSWAADRHGAMGAGWAWLGMNALYLAGWAPLVHHHLHKGLNRPWFVRDVASIAIPLVLAGMVLSQAVSIEDARWVTVAKVVGVLLALVAGGSALTTTGLARARAWLVDHGPAAGKSIG